MTMVNLKENQKKIKETMKRINMTKIELLKNFSKTNIWQNQSKKWHRLQMIPGMKKANYNF